MGEDGVCMEETVTELSVNMWISCFEWRLPTWLALARQLPRRINDSELPPYSTQVPQFPSVFSRTMAASKSVCHFIRPVRCINGSRCSARRQFATARPETPTLPLAGIRVLDMTRVLAGVSSVEGMSQPSVC